MERIGAEVRETAEAFPTWGHRKIWALLGYDGINASQSGVERAMRYDFGDEFEFGLDLILDGLAAAHRG